MFQSFNAWEREQVWGCKYLKWVIIKYYLDHFVQLQFWTWKKYFKSWLLNWMAKYLITTCFNCYVSPKVLPWKWNGAWKSVLSHLSPLYRDTKRGGATKAKCTNFLAVSEYSVHTPIVSRLARTLGKNIFSIMLRQMQTSYDRLGSRLESPSGVPG